MHQSTSQLGSDSLTSERTGKDSSASQHQWTSQLRSDPHRRDSSSPKRTGSDSSATNHQSASQVQSDRHRPRSTERTGTDSSASRHQSTSKLTSHRSDLNLQFTPTPALLCHIDKGRTVILVSVLRPVVTSLTDHL